MLNTRPFVKHSDGLGPRYHELRLTPIHPNALLIARRCDPTFKSTTGLWQQFWLYSNTVTHISLPFHCALCNILYSFSFPLPLSCHSELSRVIFHDCYSLSLLFLFSPFLANTTPQLEWICAQVAFFYWVFQGGCLLQ